MNSVVSVIVPVYNTEKFLKKCLNSLIQQSYKKMEIIIINDGSTDQSGEIIREFEKKYSNIFVIEQKNQGLSVARNTGIQKANGDYLAFVDSDDYVAVDYILHLVQIAEKRNADMVICGYEMVDERGKSIQRIIPQKYEKNIHEEWAARIMAACFRLVRRKFWMENELYFSPHIWGEDLPIVFYLNAMCNTIEVAPYAEYFYVQHSASIRHSMKGLKNEKMPYEAIEKVCCKMNERGIVNSLTFAELSLIKIFTVFVFDLGRGASTQSLDMLLHYIYEILNSYFEGWKKRIGVRTILKTSFPFILKLELLVFTCLLKTNCLYNVAKIYCRIFA